MQIQIFPTKTYMFPETLIYMVQVGMNDPAIAKQLQVMVSDPQVLKILQVTEPETEKFKDLYYKILEVLKPISDNLLSRRGQIAI